MRSNAKTNSNKKSIRKSASDTKIADRNKHPTKIEVVNSEPNTERKLSKNLDTETESSGQNSSFVEDTEPHNDLWMLKYDINEKGIGKILLPPSLSLLLQSDRVSISPAAGGLFIRSI